MDKVKQSFGIILFHFTIVWFKNAKINCLKKIRVLSPGLSNRSASDYKPKKKLIFGDFQKSSAAHTIIIVSVLFHVNMFDQRQCSLITNLFCQDWCPLLVSMWKFKGRLNGTCQRLINFLSRKVIFIHNEQSLKISMPGHR